MHESDAYYEEILYPLQNGVLSTLAACEAPFYLTGGTALHRYYFGFRICLRCGRIHSTTSVEPFR